MNKVMHTEKICDFQIDASWWTSKSELRWRTSVATRLNRNQVMKVLRLVSCENLVCERKEFTKCRKYCLFWSSVIL